MSRGSILWTIVVALIVLLHAPSAMAHERSVSHSSWRVSPDASVIEVRTRARARALAALPDATPGSLRSYLQGSLGARAEAGPCTLRDDAFHLRDEGGWITARWMLACPAGPITELRSDLLAGVAGHAHLARVHQAATGATEERLLTGETRTWTLRTPSSAPAGTAWTRAQRFFRLGLTHIAGGPDHLVFLLALMLAAGSLRALVLIVTGFTLGHAAALCATVLGLVAPRGDLVEALIGLSIAAVAAENAWLREGRRSAWIPAAALATVLAVAALATIRPGGAAIGRALLGVVVLLAVQFAIVARATTPDRPRAALAAAFGLVHGFGFAGAAWPAAALTDAAGIAPALLGFNLGVELGQLALVALAWPVTRWLLRRAGTRSGRAALAVADAVVVACGVYWLLTRVFAP